MENPRREEKMGRRKKEPEHVHREAIASAAEDLFVHKGIQAATMDDIAKKSNPVCVFCKQGGNRGISCPKKHETSLSKPFRQRFRAGNHKG